MTFSDEMGGRASALAGAGAGAVSAGARSEQFDTNHEYPLCSQGDRETKQQAVVSMKIVPENTVTLF